MSDAQTGGGVPLAVQLSLGGRRVVVVGAGPVGARRASTLLDAGADVVVIAPEVTARMDELSATGRLHLSRRVFRPTDLDGAALVVVATGSSDGVADQVVDAAAERGVLVNRADDGPSGDVTFPAVVRRGPLQVAVSTGSTAPGVAKWVAGQLDAGLDEMLGLDRVGVALLLELAAELRAADRAGPAGEPGVSSGPLDWRSALDGSILELIRQGRKAEAKERLKACRSSS